MVHNEWYQKFTSRSLDFAEEKNTGFVGIFFMFLSPHTIPFTFIEICMARQHQGKVRKEMFVIWVN